MYIIINFKAMLLNYEYYYKSTNSVSITYIVVLVHQRYSYDCENHDIRLLIILSYKYGVGINYFMHVFYTIIILASLVFSFCVTMNSDNSKIHTQ